MVHRSPLPRIVALHPLTHALILLCVSACARGDRTADTTAGQTAAATGVAQRSLYERLGGKDAITSVVDTFVARVAADTRINKKFARSDIPRVKAMLVDQICSATGGPCTYTGRDMREAHRNMGVTEGEFNALVEDLVATLNQFNVAKGEQDELLAILGSMKSAIVERQTTETGAPLPAAFKAAPPLGRDTTRR
jgi:hemoglobin